MICDYTEFRQTAILVMVASIALAGRNTTAQMSQPTMKGLGSEQMMLIKGSIVADGQPAQDYELRIQLKRKVGRQNLSPKVEGDQFEVWVPIVSDWSYLELSASTADGKQRAFQGVLNSQFRQTAIAGLQLDLIRTSRTVAVSVIENGIGVANAHVVAQMQGNLMLSGRTASDGKAIFHLLDDERLNELAAWTDDFKVGGYVFDRKPRHDPQGDEFTVELNKCRDQRIRFHDVDGRPVPNVQFLLTVGTGPPNYNFPGTPDTLPQSKITTNEAGEAIYRWFPDWEKHGSYAEIINARWAKVDSSEMKSADDGALVVKLKPRTRRTPFAGYVTTDDGLHLGGLLVTLRSFQGEEDNRSDQLHAFTGNDGRFEADCIPGSVYCMYVDDAAWVSNTIDLMPYKPGAGKSNTASLHVSEGVPVEISLTSGPDHMPIRNQWISLRAPHEYTWRENGEERRGGSGRQFGVRTNDDGTAVARALAGSKLVASVYAGEWRSGEQQLIVKPDGTSRFEFHRQITAHREIQGRLIASSNTAVSLANVEVILGSIDGETDERKTTKTDESGGFAFKTRAVRFGVFAYSFDGKWAGIATPPNDGRSFEVQLKPTVDLHGQLLGKNDQPLADHAVRVESRVSGKRDFSKPFATSFLGKLYQSKTDNEGNYTLNSLPIELDMTLRADPIDNSDRDAYLDSFFLQLDDHDRPRMVSRLDRGSKPDDQSLSAKYESILRDAKLGDCHLIVLVYNETANEFVNEQLLPRSETKEIDRYMQLKIREGNVVDAANSEFVKSKNWPHPKRNTVFACALDGAGNVLGQIEMDITKSEAADTAMKFIREHAPPISDAEVKWATAFAEANRSNRKVWARVTQRYCGPCFLMARWLDDNHALLASDFVILKIDDVRDKNGLQVARRIASNHEGFGVPFHAIFDADEKLLIDSESPSGNIGHPASFEGRRHLRKMLVGTRTTLTDDELDRIVKSLENLPESAER